MILAHKILAEAQITWKILGLCLQRASACNNWYNDKSATLGIDIVHNSLCVTLYRLEDFQTIYFSLSTMISATWVTKTSATPRITLAILIYYTCNTLTIGEEYY